MAVLLERFYDPELGGVYIDGRSLFCMRSFL